MRKSIKLMFALLALSNQACSPLGEPVDFDISDNFYFDKSGSDIIYSSMGNWFELGQTPLGADAESFDVLNAHLGKDKRNAYYKYHTIPSSEIDLMTFDASYRDWMWHIGMDRYNVYAFSDDVIDGEWQLVMSVIDGADPDTFMKIDYQWSKDKDNHFYNHQMINVAYGSFEVINETFAKDRDSVYLFYQDRFESIDAEASTLEEVDGYYVRDSNNIYFFLDYSKGQQIERLVKIPYEESSTIRVLKDNYLLTDESVYYRCSLIDGAYPKHFQVLSYDFAKDDQTVYYQDTQIEGADASTFKYDEEIYSYRDKHRIYNNEELTKRTSRETNDEVI